MVLSYAYGRVWSSDKTNRIRISKLQKILKPGFLKNLYQSKFENVTELDSITSDVDTLIMGLRLYDGFKISKLNNKSIINYDALNNWKTKKFYRLKMMF